jgi:hypothetical protein
MTNSHFLFQVPLQGTTNMCILRSPKKIQNGFFFVFEKIFAQVVLERPFYCCPSVFFFLGEQGQNFTLLQGGATTTTGVFNSNLLDTAPPINNKPKTVVQNLLIANHLDQLIYLINQDVVLDRALVFVSLIYIEQKRMLSKSHFAEPVLQVSTALHPKYIW